MSENDPLLSIEKFRYADSVRTLKRRQPGSCSTLLNLAPNQGEGERIRRGYAAYTAVTAPMGMQILKVAPIQTPSQEDVHIWFADDSGQKVYQNPYWFGSSKQSSNINIGETLLAVNPADVDVTVNPKSIVIANAGTNGFNITVSQYYKNWVINKNGTSQYALIKDATLAGTTLTLTTVETVGAGGYAWATSSVFNLYRNFHDNLTFSPEYNADLANAPSVLSDRSVVYLSGGQGSSANKKGLVSQYINRELFPSDGTNKFTFTGTYVCEERLKSPQTWLANTVYTAGAIGGGSTDGLEVDKTYWIAFSAVYDGFQIGELWQWARTDHGGVAGNWTYNYLSSAAGTDEAIDISVGIDPSKLDKRVTGIILWLAQDNGQTTVRKNQYHFLRHLPIDSTNSFGSVWSFTVGNGFEADFTGTDLINGLLWSAKGATYLDCSGIDETQADTSYSYSQRVVVADRHYISNVYITSEGITNREEVFTNPRGALQGVNAGITAKGMFSNDQGFYRHAVEFSLGTKINAMTNVGLSELLVIKDRGIIMNRIVENEDGTISLIAQILDYDAGCSTLNALVKADDNLIYFVGYDDIYSLGSGGYNPLIERADQQDWLYQYREGISKSAKEGISLAYMPEGIILVDINQAIGQQFALYTKYQPDGWRQVAFKQSSGFVGTVFFKWFAKLQNGALLAVSTETTPTVYQFSNPTNGVYYYKDDTTQIKYQLDTGNLVPSGTVTRDTFLDRWQVSRYLDAATQGTLECAIYRDGVAHSVLTAMDNTSLFLKAAIKSDAKKIGNSWRLVVNNNATPETLNSGTDFRIPGIYLFGSTLPRQRVSDAAYLSGVLVSNTVSGVNEVLLNRTPQTFTWDRAFLLTYTSPNEAVSVPLYTIEEASTPYVLGSDRSQRPTVVISERTLTTFTAYSSEDSTVFRFRATE